VTKQQKIQISDETSENSKVKKLKKQEKPVFLRVRPGRCEYMFMVGQENAGIC
jgi:hypothetical protein